MTVKSVYVPEQEHYGAIAREAQMLIRNIIVVKDAFQKNAPFTITLNVTITARWVGVKGNSVNVFFGRRLLLLDLKL